MSKDNKAKMEEYQKLLGTEYSRFMQTNEQIRTMMAVNEQRFKSMLEINQRMGALFVGDIKHIVPPGGEAPVQPLTGEQAIAKAAETYGVPAATLTALAALEATSVERNTDGGITVNFDNAPAAEEPTGVLKAITAGSASVPPWEDLPAAAPAVEASTAPPAE